MAFHECREVVFAGDETPGAFLSLALVLADIDPPAQPLRALIARGILAVGLADLDAADPRVVKRLLGHDNEAVRIAVRQLDATLGPQTAQMMAPSLLQACEKQIGAAE